MHRTAETALSGTLTASSIGGPRPLGSRRTLSARRSRPAHARYGHSRPTRARPAPQNRGSWPPRAHRRQVPTHRPPSGSRGPPSRARLRLDPQLSAPSPRTPATGSGTRGIAGLTRTGSDYRRSAHWTPSYSMPTGPSSPSTDGLTHHQRHPPAPADGHRHRLRPHPQRDGHHRPQHGQQEAPEQAPPEQGPQQQAPPTRLKVQSSHRAPRDPPVHGLYWGLSWPQAQQAPQQAHGEAHGTGPLQLDPQRDPHRGGRHRLYWQFSRAGAQPSASRRVGGRVRLPRESRSRGGSRPPGDRVPMLATGVPPEYGWYLGAQQGHRRLQSETPTRPETGALTSEAVLPGPAGDWGSPRRWAYRNPERGYQRGRIRVLRSPTPTTQLRRGEGGSTAEPPASARVRPSDTHPHPSRWGSQPGGSPCFRRGCLRGLVAPSAPEVARAS